MYKIDKKSFLGVKNAGFTLIELLVVVLIIGILAAVALPQYNKAVAKARFSELLVKVQALKNAQELFYMATGAYTANLEDLDISMPDLTKSKEGIYTFDGGYCNLHADNGTQLHCFLVLGNVRNGFLMLFDNTTVPGYKYCYASPSRTDFMAVCLGLGGVVDGGPLQDGAIRYRLPN